MLANCNLAACAQGSMQAFARQHVAGMTNLALRHSSTAILETLDGSAREPRAKAETSITRSSCRSTHKPLPAYTHEGHTGLPGVLHMQWPLPNLVGGNRTSASEGLGGCPVKIPVRLCAAAFQLQQTMPLPPTYTSKHHARCIHSVLVTPGHFSKTATFDRWQVQACRVGRITRRVSALRSEALVHCSLIGAINGFAIIGEPKPKILEGGSRGGRYGSASPTSCNLAKHG